ncbi:MAG: trigger factor [Prolixibacteraceae bacterium]|nr:trigger factor [Prolixibacteraceae bacterium]
MNITRENIDELNGLIRVSIEKTDYESKVEEALKDYRKKANMPGFRPGKIPAGLVKKMYGKSAMVDEVNKLLTHELSKYLVNEKLNILGEPLPNETEQKSIDWDLDTDFEFVFDIGYAPEVKLALDKRSKFTLYQVEISDDMINQQVESYTNRFGESQPCDVVLANGTVRGNIVQLDADGQVKEDGAQVEMALISIEVIKDETIKDMFVGKKVDDEVVFDIKKAYPNNTEIGYLLNIDRKEAEAIEGDFKITIKEIKQFVPATVDVELFKKIYGEETEIADEAAFRAGIVSEIEAAYLPSSDYKFANDTRDTLVEKTAVELPVDFLKRWLMATNKELTLEQIESEFDLFVADLKWQVIKEQIIKENELKVDEKEVVELAKEVASAQFRQYGMFSVPDEHLMGFVHQMLSKEDDRNRLYSKKMEDKIMEVVKSKVTVSTKKVSREEFEKLFEK